jgi:hypothetical protein
MNRLVLQRNGATRIDVSRKIRGRAIRFADYHRDTSDRLARLLVFRCGWLPPVVRSLTSCEQCQHESELT